MNANKTDGKPMRNMLYLHLHMRLGVSAIEAFEFTLLYTFDPGYGGYWLVARGARDAPVTRMLLGYGPLVYRLCDRLDVLIYPRQLNADQIVSRRQ